MSTSHTTLEPFRVCVRVRGADHRPTPTTPPERRCVVADPPHSRVTLRHPDDPTAPHKATDETSQGRTFAFHGVFGEGATNAAVYAAAVAPYVRSAMEGYHAACVAYGATGSGKTFTMGGDATRGVDGVAALAVRDLCSQTCWDEGCLEMGASLVEIYNERVRDLGGGETMVERRAMDVVDSAEGVVVKGVVEHKITSLEALDTLLHVGAARRTTAFTFSNHVSSRSHSVLTLTLRRRMKDERFVRASRLTFVDLAGSEKLAEALHGCEDAARRREGSTINKSLLALGYCLLLLSRGSSHIPYRDSILTRILRDTLGGNTRTVMIATISPESRAYEETLSTLKYASSALCITRGVHCNEAVRTPLEPSTINEGRNHQPASTQRCRDIGGDENATDVLHLRAQLKKLKLQLRVMQQCNEMLGFRTTAYADPARTSRDQSPRPDTEGVVSALRRDVHRSIRSSERRLVSPRLSHSRGE